MESRKCCFDKNLRGGIQNTILNREDGFPKTLEAARPSL